MQTQARETYRQSTSTYIARMRIGPNDRANKNTRTKLVSAAFWSQEALRVSAYRPTKLYIPQQDGRLSNPWPSTLPLSVSPCHVHAIPLVITVILRLNEKSLLTFAPFSSYPGNSTGLPGRVIHVGRSSSPTPIPACTYPRYRTSPNGHLTRG